MNVACKDRWAQPARPVRWAPVALRAPAGRQAQRDRSVPKDLEVMRAYAGKSVPRAPWVLAVCRGKAVPSAPSVHAAPMAPRAIKAIWG